MSADDSKVRAGLSGVAYWGAVGVTAPADPYASWGAGWTDLGGITEDGLTESLGEDRQTWKRWGSNSPVRTQVVDRVTTFKLNFMETNVSVLQLYYSVQLADITSSGTGASQFLSFTDPASTDPFSVALGLDVFDDDKVKRMIIPRCEVTTRGDLNHNRSNPTQYELTFTTLEAPSGGASITRMFGLLALPS